MTGDSPQDYWLGFDLGGTKMLAALYDADFHEVARRRRRTKGHEGTKAGLDRIITCIQRVLAEAGVRSESVSGMGIGCPGPLDIDLGIILEAPNLGWENVEVKKTLEQEFNCPVVIANDVDAGVYGEYRLGAARSARCVLGVFPGTGIGGGCVYEGLIIRGKTSSCMEVGHVQVIPDGPRCSCGQAGCLEAVASRLAISASVAQASFRGHAPKLRKIAGTDLSNIRSGVLAEAIESGDEVVEQIVRQAARFVGAAVGNFVHLLSPDVVVLGGGLVEAMEELFIEEVSSQARSFVLPSFKQSFRVVAAQLGDNATAMGAAAWAREMIDSSNRS